MTGTSAAVQATCRRSAYRQYRPAGRKAKYGRFSVSPRPENYRNLRIKDSVKIGPACGSGGMFVQTGDFVNQAGMSANSAMTFYGQEKVEYNAQLCLMNMAVHGLTGVIKSGDEANTFYHDAHNLAGECDYVMANPPFNVDKVNAETAQSAGRLPLGLLQKVKAKIAELDHWTDKQETKATIDTLIRDTLWAELPECYDEISISTYRQKIYEYVYTRYPEVA